MVTVSSVSVTVNWGYPLGIPFLFLKTFEIIWDCHYIVLYLHTQLKQTL